MFGIEVAVVALAILGLAAFLARRKSRALQTAPRGTVRIETVKSRYVASTLNQYVAAGWTVRNQSTAKSIGTSPRVTIMFEKV